MLYRSAFQAANNNDFSLFEKMRDSIAESKVKNRRGKDKLNKTIEEYSRSGDASKMGRMQRQFFARNDDDTLFGAMSRTSIIALDALFNAPRISLEKLQETASKLFYGLPRQELALRPEPPKMADQFKLKTVSIEFAAHVKEYVAEHIKAAPEAAQQVLDKNPTYMIPWAPNVAPLKAAFDNGDITQEQASQQLQRAILNNNGIHSVENGQEHLIKATKLFEMKKDFSGSTRNMLFGNTQLKVFNDQALAKPQEDTQAVIKFAPQAPRPSFDFAPIPAFK